MTKKDEAKKVEVETPMCKNCGENPRYELTNKKTGKKYFWTYCRDCETSRQKTNRAKRRIRNTPIEELELNIAPQTALKNANFETVGDLMKHEGDLSELEGIGPKTVKQIALFLENSGLGL